MNRIMLLCKELVELRLAGCSRLSDDAVDAMKLHGGLHVLDISAAHAVSNAFLRHICMCVCVSVRT